MMYLAFVERRWLAGEINSCVDFCPEIASYQILAHRHISPPSFINDNSWLKSVITMLLKMTKE